MKRVLLGSGSKRVDPQWVAWPSEAPGATGGLSASAFSGLDNSDTGSKLPVVPSEAQPNWVAWSSEAPPCSLGCSGPAHEVLARRHATPRSRIVELRRMTASHCAHIRLFEAHSTIARPRGLKPAARFGVFGQVALLSFLVLTGCGSPGRRAELLKNNDALQRENRQLHQSIADRDGEIAQLNGRVAALKGFGEERPADLFAPVRLEIASRSGGADYDGKPGDDGVTVYLRPRDADGDSVKTPGHITIQIIDNTDLEDPRVLGVYTFSDADELRALWNSVFFTDHYSLKCPFADGVEPPSSRRVTVSAVFVDYLTGKTLTAVREVSISW